MKPTIKKIKTMHIIGVKGKCNMKTTMQDIPPILAKLMKNKDEIKNMVDEDVSYGINIMIDQEHFWCIAGFEISKENHVPVGMVYEKIPAMKVASFIHKGKVETMKDTYEKIMREYIPMSGLTIDFKKPSIEMYDERFIHGSDESECEIWIPVK